MFARKSAGFVMLAATLGLTGMRAAANPGDLDPTFGTGGMVITSFGRSGVANAVAVGFTNAGTYRFALARYNGDGSLDGSFGTAGQVTTSFGGGDLAGPVALQDDGKIVAAGVAGGRFALARYETDGSLDPTFGTAGQVTTSFGGTYDEAWSIALQGD